MILTLTRQQAEFVSELIIAGAADRNLAGHVAGRVGHGWTTGRVQRSLVSARKKMDLAIRKRDRAQALKEGRGTERQVGRTMVEIDSPLFSCLSTSTRSRGTERQVGRTMVEIDSPLF